MRSEVPEAPLKQIPFVSVLCSTYGRPKFLANAFSCFLGQDYPATRRQLLILDDRGDFDATTADNMQLFSTKTRFPSTAAKYNWLAAKADGEVLVIFDDDDVYMPWHVSAQVRAMESGLWAKPSTVQMISTDAMLVSPTNAKGRFHGTLALDRAFLAEAGGWYETPRSDWSLSFIRGLNERHPPADTLDADPRPSYVYRLHKDGLHASAAMRSQSDEEWYERYGARLDAAVPIAEKALALAPQFDLTTLYTYRQLGAFGASRGERNFSPGG